MPMVQRESELKGGWRLAVINSLAAGQANNPSSDEIDESQSPRANNVRFNKGHVFSDFGYDQIGSVIRGNPRLIYQFFKKNETDEELLITDATIYKLNEAFDEWDYLASDVSTTTTASLSAGGTSLTVADITGFSDADFLGVALDNGQQHRTTINGAPAGSTIVMTDAVPAGRTVNNGAIVLLPPVYSGAADKIVDAVTEEANDWVIFVNGVDKPQRYDGTSVEVVPNLPAGGDFIARTVEVFNNYTIFGFCVEGGTNFPQRIRRSDTGDPSNWTTGDSGFDDLVDSGDAIARLSSIGPYVAVYRDRSIWRISWVGSTDRVFLIEAAIEGIGLIAPGAVISTQDFDIFMGTTSIYKYEGGFDIEDIATSLQNQIIGEDGELNTAFKDRTMGVLVEELFEGWFIYPVDGGSEYPSRIAKYKIPTGAWTFRDLTDPISGIGTYRKQSGTTWAAATGTWAAATGSWDSLNVLADSAIIIFGAQTTLKTMKYDFMAIDDDGVAISWSIDTKDFSLFDRKVRTDQLNFLAKGTNILVEYSLDRGATWNTWDTVAPGSALIETRTYQQVVADAIRFRFSGTDPTLELGWFSFTFREESRW